jgi:hypothetical protein
MLFIFRHDFHRLLVACYLFLVFLNTCVKLDYFLIACFYLFCYVFIPFGLSHHILLNTLFVIYVISSNLLQFLFFDSQFLRYTIIMSLLIVNFADIDPLTVLLELYQHVIQIFQLFVIVLFFDELNLKILLMLFELLLDYSPIRY